MDVNVRMATKNDIPRMLELYKELQPNDLPIDLNSAVSAWEQATGNDVVYFVAVCDGTVAATCYIAIIQGITKQCACLGFIENVVVASEYRRRGIGRKLLEAAVEYAKKRGCYKVTLQSGNARSEAHKLYEAIGFDGNSKRAYELRF